uniref:Uncharacterized protein n=1 Tax=Arundo donax TaxID=35708 RepID=A0A0A9FHC6_ARUDO
MHETYERDERFCIRYADRSSLDGKHIKSKGPLHYLDGGHWCRVLSAEPG